MFINMLMHLYEKNVCNLLYKNNACSLNSNVVFKNKIEKYKNTNFEEILNEIAGLAQEVAEYVNVNKVDLFKPLFPYLSFFSGDQLNCFVTEENINLVLRNLFLIITLRYNEDLLYSYVTMIKKTKPFITNLPIKHKETDIDYLDCNYKNQVYIYYDQKNKKYYYIKNIDDKKIKLLRLYYKVLTCVCYDSLLDEIKVFNFVSEKDLELYSGIDKKCLLSEYEIEEDRYFILESAFSSMYYEKGRFSLSGLDLYKLLNTYNIKIVSFENQNMSFSDLKKTTIEHDDKNVFNLINSTQCIFNIFYDSLNDQIVLYQRQTNSYFDHSSLMSREHYVTYNKQFQNNPKIRNIEFHASIGLNLSIKQFIKWFNGQKIYECINVNKFLQLKKQLGRQNGVNIFLSKFLFYPQKDALGLIYKTNKEILYYNNFNKVFFHLNHLDDLNLSSYNPLNIFWKIIQTIYLTSHIVDNAANSLEYILNNITMFVLNKQTYINEYSGDKFQLTHDYSSLSALNEEKQINNKIAPAQIKNYKYKNQTLDKVDLSQHVTQYEISSFTDSLKTYLMLKFEIFKRTSLIFEINKSSKYFTRFYDSPICTIYENNVFDPRVKSFIIKLINPKIQVNYQIFKFIQNYNQTSIKISTGTYFYYLYNISSYLFIENAFDSLYNCLNRTAIYKATLYKQIKEYKTDLSLYLGQKISYYNNGIMDMIINKEHKIHKVDMFGFDLNNFSQLNSNKTNLQNNICILLVYNIKKTIYYKKHRYKHISKIDVQPTIITGVNRKEFVLLAGCNLLCKYWDIEFNIHFIIGNRNTDNGMPFYISIDVWSFAEKTFTLIINKVKKAQSIIMSNMMPN
ncbi:hypothetical protein AB837_00392 [bacterium AB1]|nr:hypothetical protein AB837_00392 [bacterium AB1]